MINKLKNLRKGKYFKITGDKGVNIFSRLFQNHFNGIQKDNINRHSESLPERIQPIRKSWITSHSLVMTKNRKKLINLSTYKPIYFQKTAFTLAEILITLGIIGIVAAITIPLITNAYQRIVYPNQLKAVYSRLTNAQKSINDEFGPPEDWSYSSYKRPDEGNANNLIILERYATELGAIAWTKKRANSNYYHYYGISNAPKKLNGQPATNSIKDWPGGLYNRMYNYQMLLKNGTSLAIIFSDEPGGATFWDFIKKGYYAVFVVDINGLGKPNMLGRDIFVFALTKGYSSIVPYSTNTSDCNKNDDGLSCSKKIIDDGWKMTY